jgi:hypothetical protein
MPRSDRRYRATAMDRVFADARIIAVTGPTTGLDPQRTRATLSAAENASDAPRLALVPRTDSQEWKYDTGNADTIVEHRPDARTDDLGRLLTDIRNRPGTRKPLEVLIWGDYLAVDFSHGIGDGQMGLMLMSAFSDDPDGTLAPSLAVSLPPNATWKALRRHYRRNPKSLRDFWRLRGTHKQRSDAGAAATKRVENWEASKVSRSGYMAPEQVSELKAWAKTTSPNATGAALSIALWAAALRAENVDLDDRIAVLFNSRRYLGPEYLGAHGNFAVAIPLHLPASSSPSDIASVMRQVIDSGWPIAILGMSQIKNAVASIRPKPAAPQHSSVIEVPSKLRLAVSDLGKLPMFGQLNFATDGRPPQVAASLEPDGPDGVTMLIAELGGGRTYTASYCSTFVDDAVIDAALARLCTDPVGLLQDVRT